MTNIITVSDAIQSLRPTSNFTLSGDVIDWLDTEQSQPTALELSNEVTRLQAEYDAQAYARNRALEYPSLLELTVALYDTDDKSAVEAKRAAVKLKYPKPE
jgi:hypothetical protein